MPTVGAAKAMEVKMKKPYPFWLGGEYYRRRLRGWVAQY